MAKNPLFELYEAGTSVWLDYISRSLMSSGELKRMIEEDAVVGMTSNPTIFEKAIGGSSDYDEALNRLIAGGKSDEEVMLSLIVEDIQMAADVLKPVYEQTKQKDGYVSIEVLPRVAHDTKGTVAMAHDLFDRVGRPNIFIKIPATQEGLPAIEQCIADGININITLLFSVKVYEDVARAYLRGLQRRLKDGKPVDIASVASFFVSRVDTAVDKLLDQKIAAAKDPAERERLQRLLGKAAVANAKMAYESFLKIFNEPEFAELRRHGASVQRCLWASTGTKNPNYSDVMYVEELIGPETVNTMPQQTMMAFKEHGEVRVSLLENVDGARQVLRDLEAIGVDMDKVTYDLQVDGVKLFADSMTKLLDEIANKKKRLKGGDAGAHEAQLGAIEGAVKSRLTQLEQAAVVRRIAEKDAGLWASNGSGEKEEIKNRLGWLQVADLMEERVSELVGLRTELVAEGFTDCVVMGMGGSSLAPEVFRQTFGAPKGALNVHVLDTTDPAAIAALQAAIDLKRTVFIVASKSGTTLETLSHYRYFWLQTGQQGRQFLAITDPGTTLADEGNRRAFRRVFLNPADIGGRYSALSYFGLVPAALGGVDLAGLLDRAATMVQACTGPGPVDKNPGVWLGAVFAEAAKAGRDKVTIVAPPALQSFGVWAEQLIAESTGKQGKGLVPVADEALGAPPLYGSDRLFVRLALPGDDPNAGRLEALSKAGHPVVTLKVSDPLGLGAEFFRWEYAIAVAGAILAINVFDQPNVQEAKDLTKKVLSEGNPPTTGDGIRWAGQQGATLEAAIQALLGQVRPGDYVALLAFIAPDAKHDSALNAIRLAIRDKYRVATAVGYGPRYLHSTGQLHKGGPNTGVFLQIVGDDPKDIPIPGERFSFGVLKQAQALGDFQALRNHGRRVLRVQLQDVAQGLVKIGQAVGATAGVA
jgi:transaldolase / glucose-6-phosphate isomerase